MPSKSARKRELLALQAMGEQLIQLKDSELDRIPLEEPLRTAVGHARRIQSRSALRRQRQLIGKLMREADAATIRSSLEAIRRQESMATQAFHAAEDWRDRIVTQGAPALAQLFELTGNRSTMLEALLRDLDAAVSDTARRAVGRRIFREVRNELVAARPAAAPPDAENEAR